MPIVKVKRYFFGQQHSKRIQLFRSLLVSSLSTAVDYSTLFILLHFQIVGFVAAGSYAMVAGLVVTYFVNRRWVFPAIPGRYFQHELISFIATSAVGAGLHTAVLFVGSPWVTSGAGYFLVKTIAVSCMFLWNFSMRRLVNSSILKHAARQSKKEAA